MHFYPGLARKTAVLASRLINNHPLPDDEGRVGHLCALEFVARDGGSWTHPPQDPDGDSTVAMIEGVGSPCRGRLRVDGSGSGCHPIGRSGP